MADLPLECRLLDCHTPSLPLGEEVGRDDDDDLFRTRATEVVSPALSADNDVSILEAAYSSSYDHPNGQGNDLVYFAATTSLSHSDNFENNNNNNYNLPCWYSPPSTTASAPTQPHHHTRSPPQFLKSTSLTISSVLLLHDEERLNSEAEAEAMLHRLQTQQPRHAVVRDDHHEDVSTTSDIENAIMHAHCNASSPACRATTAAAAAARPRSSSPSKLCRQHCEVIRRPCTTSCNPPTHQSLPDSASSLEVHAKLVQSETSCSIASPDE